MGELHTSTHTSAETDHANISTYLSIFITFIDVLKIVFEVCCLSSLAVLGRDDMPILTSRGI